MIEELVLQNFRGFNLLDLKGLKPVNLIVGHNNVGKTSLLEGILLLCERGKSKDLPGMFRPEQGDANQRYFPWLIRDGSQNRSAILKYRERGRENTVLLQGADSQTLPAGFIGPIGMAGYLKMHEGSGQQANRNLICRVISVQNREPGSVVSLVGKASKKGGGEEKLQELIAKLDSRITKIRIDPGSDGNQVIVDIGLSELLPLAQLGQGVYRLATILADILGDPIDVLLIDEIENGLHHSVQKQVWTGLAAVAKELNVQIFATTHSGECLQAANRAFSEVEPYDLAVIQLFRDKDGAQGRVLDKKHIEAAIKADIELR